jgi:hypothetical protein
MICTMCIPFTRFRPSENSSVGCAGRLGLGSVETVRATVEAFAAGRIHLSAVAPKTSKADLRVAPSFKPVGKNDDLREHFATIYTIKSVAEFIGWLEPAPVTAA